MCYFRVCDFMHVQVRVFTQVVALVMVLVGSIFVLGFQPTLLFAVGVSLVLAAIFIYYRFPVVESSNSSKLQGS